MADHIKTFDQTETSPAPEGNGTSMPTTKPTTKPGDGTAAAAPDPFDLGNLRLDQSFAETAGVKKLLHTVPVGGRTRKTSCASIPARIIATRSP